MHAPRSRRTARALGARMLLGSAIALLGCSSEVELQGSGSTGGPRPAGGSLCGGVVDPVKPDQPKVDLRAPSSGTFVGDHLHVNALLDGAEQYVVLEIADEAAFVVAAPKALQGPARLVPVAESTYARLRALGSDGASQVDVIDTSSPREPALIAEHPVAGNVLAKWQGVFSAHEGLLYFCLQAEPDAAAALAMLDLTAPQSPGELGVLPGSTCGDFFDGGFASGPLWLSWTVGDDIQASQIMSYEVSSKGLTKGIEWGYNPTGVHDYGFVKSAATDGTRVVLDPTSDAWFLLFTATTLPPKGPYTSFALPGPKRLLTVASQIAYFATPNGVHAYDVSDENAPVLTDYHAEIALDPALTTFLAASPRYLAIADQDGSLYLVPRNRSGKVAPASVYRGAPVIDPGAPAACDD